MITALLLTTPSLAAEALLADLGKAGVDVLATCEQHSLVQDAIRLAPGVLVCHAPRADASLFGVLQVLHTHAPLPVVLFTADVDAAHIEQGLSAGVQEFVFGACEPRRLRPTLQLAQARFRLQRSTLDQLGSVTQRFEERKLVDRAKGILMAMRGLSESDAFAVLRTAAMQGAMRVGEAAQAVLDGARLAADVNRSGQLRMLSQRIVKLQALIATATSTAKARALHVQSLAKAGDVVAALREDLSPASFGDLLEGLVQAWQALQAAAAGPVTQDGLRVLDAAADDLLRHSETLTAALEHAGSGTALRVVNLAGRQRMLSQRCAKLALLGAGAAEVAQAREEFAQGLLVLEGLPLKNAEIQASLTRVRTHWQQLQPALDAVGTKAARETVALSSEALLDELETLTSLYQRTLQVLMG